MRRLVRAVLWYLLALPLLAVAGLTLLYTVVPPPITPLMVIRWVQGEGLQQDWRPLSELSPDLPRAVIASEDNRFCEHHGIDWPAFWEQVERWRAGERPRGASTITMQTTKNLFLWPGRDPLRKALELALTPAVDAVLGKRRAMELYLNIVEFGPGVYGAEAAAKHWFNKGADALTAQEAATLAVLLPAPLSYRAEEGFVGRQAARVRSRMQQLGRYYFACLDTA